MTLYRLNELHDSELQRRIAVKPLLVLPFGTIEWHSYHLPIGLDNLVAEGVAERTAGVIDAVLAPLTSWAVGGVPFPHTIRFDAALIESLMVSIFEQMSLLGFSSILAISGHFGLEQTLALKRAAFTMMRRSALNIWAGGVYEPVVSKGYIGDHAAHWETALLYALRPDLVRLEGIPANTALDGIIGADPRTTDFRAVSADVLDSVVRGWSEIGGRLLSLTPLSREQFVEALGIGVRVLQKTAGERAIKPKAQVPSLNSPQYLRHLAALSSGDYVTAQQAAQEKFSDLRQ